MKIAIDGRALTTLRTGGGCYTYYLLKGLLEKDGNNRYLVCAHKKITADITAENLDFRIDRFPLGILWQHAGLPRTLVREKVDLLHSPIFTLPHNLPCPGIVTIFSWLKRPDMEQVSRAACIFLPHFLFIKRIPRAESSTNSRIDYCYFIFVNGQAFKDVPLCTF